MTAYEIATVVHDAHIDVDPALEGQHVRAIILALSTGQPPEPQPSASPIGLLKKEKATEAMRQLKGSGNGNLIESLLKERKMDKLK